MPSAKPCLGYPSRTDAVLALRANGLTTSAIAARIGIESTTVTALEASARRRSASRTHAPRPPQRPDAIPIDSQTLRALRPHAARRQISVPQLVRRLLDLMVDDSLVDALLDDDGGRA